MDHEEPADAGKTRALNSTEVLIREHGIVWPEGDQPTSGDAYYLSVQAKEQAALCLSGGGIRSAAFALGVLQALSAKKLLTGFHYLSSVSGGGYANGWLQRWIGEESRRPEDPVNQPPPARAEGVVSVMRKLGGDREPPQIRRLRENSNFITPRVGVGSHDTWTAVAISVRNILVNWLLILPLLLAVAILPLLFLAGVRAFPEHAGEHAVVLTGMLAAAALAIAVAALSTVRLLPSYRASNRVTPHAADRHLFRRIVFPLAVWAVLGTLALSFDFLFATPGDKSVKIPLLAFDWFDGLDLALWSFGGMLAGVLAGGLTLRGDHARTFWHDWLIWPCSILIVSLWVALGASLFNNFVYGADPDGISTIVITAAGPLWLMSGTLLGAAVFAAFRTSAGPAVKPDADREWLARLSAVKIRPMLLWALLGVSVLLLNHLAGPLLDGGELTVSGLVTLIAGFGAVAGGRSEKTRSQARSAIGTLAKYVPMNALVALATLVFIMALFFFLGRLGAELVRLAAPLLKPLLDAVLDVNEVSHEVIAYALLLVLLGLLLLVLRRKIQINRFSLNGLYRNRLARAFLGAARDPRDPDQFTGFDPADNVRMHQMRGAEGAVPLYPVVNIALNVTATENLAWQERKAGSFIASPLVCGSGMLDEDGVPPGQRDGAYYPSHLYGGSEPDLALGPTTGITLATAISISGAAASPNMGYHSSSATAFLMTLFNLRLGAWLPNPARAATLGESGLNRSSPDDSLRAMLRELAGQTDDRGLDIYLSDGGHFENLGLYEMIRRRCRYIVLSDAGADPDCAFSDLGNAIRKVKIDMDVDVEFPAMKIGKRGAELDDQQFWALGTIAYPEPGLTGTILYIKPSYYGRELPVDVVAYAQEHALFPHESTADQFFSESQFESYRRLGEHFTAQLGGRGRTWATLRDFFAALGPPPPAARKAPARRRKKPA